MTVQDNSKLTNITLLSDGSNNTNLTSVPSNIVGIYMAGNAAGMNFTALHLSTVDEMVLNNVTHVSLPGLQTVKSVLEIDGSELMSVQAEKLTTTGSLTFLSTLR